MPSFLQRIGKQPMHKAPQIDSMDAELRAGLWNVLKVFIWDHWRSPESYNRSGDADAIDRLIRTIWIHHLKWPLDDLPRHFHSAHPVGAYTIFKVRVLEMDWGIALDFIDFVVGEVPKGWQQGLTKALNAILTRENSGYRFVGTELTPITAPEEISAVESALQIARKSVRAHLESALGKLSDREHPDYRNSVKESISAVEAACQAVSGKDNASLGQCLNAIHKVKPLHGAFVEGIKSLYGYTSDAQGIRHALSDEAKDVTKADAQFMLVACSAFVNYLWSVAAETGMKLE